MRGPHKLRKIRKKRGSRTVGYGRVGQHRGVGQRVGHGKAGRHKHIWSYVQRYELDYFEKKGFRPPRKPNPVIVNVGELDEEITRFLDDGKAIKKGKEIHIDLKKLGYDKLLGGGNVTHPFVLRVGLFSESAAEKIKKAQGKILQTGEQKEIGIQPTPIDETPEIRTINAELNLTDVRGIGLMWSEKLRNIGINSVEELVGYKVKDLAKKVDISEKIVSKWIENTRILFS